MKVQCQSLSDPLQRQNVGNDQHEGSLLVSFMVYLEHDPWQLGIPIASRRRRAAPRVVATGADMVHRFEGNAVGR